MMFYRLLLSFTLALLVFARARVPVTISGVPVSVPVPWIAAAVIVPATITLIVLLFRKMGADGFRLCACAGSA